MIPGSKNDAHAAFTPPARLTPAARQTVLALAGQSIDQGLHAGAPLVVDAREYPPVLQAWHACFVTLNLNGSLRGCMGSLEARRPVVEEVSENAYAAAFRDPRFSPLTTGERSGLQLHVSILHPPEPLAVTTEAALLAQLRPGIDGLIIEARSHRATFLPAVWATLPDPVAFLRALRHKAGLAPDYWSDTLRIARYTVESIE